MKKIIFITTIFFNLIIPTKRIFGANRSISNIAKRPQIEESLTLDFEDNKSITLTGNQLSRLIFCSKTLQTAKNATETHKLPKYNYELSSVKSSSYLYCTDILTDEYQTKSELVEKIRKFQSRIQNLFPNEIDNINLFSANLNIEFPYLQNGTALYVNLLSLIAPILIPKLQLQIDSLTENDKQFLIEKLATKDPTFNKDQWLQESQDTWKDEYLKEILGINLTIEDLKPYLTWEFLYKQSYQTDRVIYMKILGTNIYASCDNTSNHSLVKINPENIQIPSKITSLSNNNFFILNSRYILFEDNQKIMKLDVKDNSIIEVSPGFLITAIYIENNIAIFTYGKKQFGIYNWTLGKLNLKTGIVEERITTQNSIYNLKKINKNYIFYSSGLELIKLNLQDQTYKVIFKNPKPSLFSLIFKLIDNFIYVTTDEGKIIKIDRETNETKEIYSCENSYFQIQFHNSNEIYVSDLLNGIDCIKIIKINKSNDSIETFLDIKGLEPKILSPDNKYIYAHNTNDKTLVKIDTKTKNIKILANNIYYIYKSKFIDHKYLIIEIKGKLFKINTETDMIEKIEDKYYFMQNHNILATTIISNSVTPAIEVFSTLKYPGYELTYLPPAQ